MQIKLSYYFATEPVLRQTPGENGVWKGHAFLDNDPQASECDYWVVLDDLAADQEVAFVGSGRTILITLEPPKTKAYERGYLAQFDLVISCHRDLPHPNVRNEYQGQTWHIGMHKGADADDRAEFTGTLGYDDFVAMALPDKPAALSVICSAASQLPGHQARRAFVEELQSQLGDRVDVFGRGVRPVPDKADAILPYRYHIALENSRIEDYWTEKLSDSYLGWSFPIYWGCPNIADYFGQDCLITIDIERPAEAIDLIAATLDEPLAAKRLAGLAAARRQVLDHYNIFDVMCRACESLPPTEPRNIVIRSKRHFKPSRIRRRAGRVVNKIKAKLRGEV